MAKFDLAKMNDRGERSLEFCGKYEIIVTNTNFEVPNVEDTLGKRYQKVSNRLYPNEEKIQKQKQI